MSLEIAPIPGNKVIDGVEDPTAAYRFSHAVTRYNIAAGVIRATFEVYAKPDDAQPPISTPIEPELGEVYTRFSYPDAEAVRQIRDIESDLI